MDDLFSLFISLGKGTNERVSLADSFEAMQRFAAAEGVAVRNQRLAQDKRMVFDLWIDQQAAVKACDMHALTQASESITVFGGNERDLRNAHLFDENNVDCFIVRLAVSLFLQGNYHVGLVATEDTLTSLTLPEFHPGYWTLFRSDRLPAFVAGVPCEATAAGVKVYRHDQLRLAGSTPEHMGRDIRRMLESIMRNEEVTL